MYQKLLSNIKYQKYQFKWWKDGVLRTTRNELHQFLFVGQLLDTDYIIIILFVNDKKYFYCCMESNLKTVDLMLKWQCFSEAAKIR